MKHTAELRDVWKSYGRGETAARAVRGISLILQSGEVTLIVGPSGSGKTTLLQLLGMLLPPDRGEVRLDGERVDRLDGSEQVARRRRDVCFVFQEFNLIEALSVHDNVDIIARLASGYDASHSDRTDHAVATVRLTEQKRRRPGQLSGGQKQRVGIARAIASDGWLVMADEPTAAIDWDSAAPIVEALAEMAHVGGRCVIIVSHDPRLEAYADRIIRLHEGAVASDEPISDQQRAALSQRHACLEPLIRAAAGEPGKSMEKQTRPRQAHRAAGPSSRRGASVARLVAVGAICLGLGLTVSYLPRWSAWSGMMAGDSSSGDGPVRRHAETLVPRGDYGDVVAAAPAVVEPWSRLIRIYSERPGRIAAILKEAGDDVQQGDVLVQLDDRTPRAEVAMREATLRLREAEAAKLRAWDRAEEQEQAAARVAGAKARLDRANRDRARIEKIRGQGAGSMDELDAALEEVQLAEAAHNEAAQRLAVSRAGPTVEQLAVAQAEIDRASSELDSAKVELELRTIRSPITGRVLYRYIEPGEVVDPQTPAAILSVGRVDRIRLRAEVDEADTGRVFEGQRVLATTAAHPDRTFTGRVVHIESVMGRKNIRTERPTEFLDSKVLEVVVALDGENLPLPVDLQMTARFLKSQATSQPR